MPPYEALSIHDPLSVSSQQVHDSFLTLMSEINRLLVVSSNLVEKSQKLSHKAVFLCAKSIEVREHRTYLQALHK